MKKLCSVLLTAAILCQMFLFSVPVLAASTASALFDFETETSMEGYRLTVTKGKAAGWGSAVLTQGGTYNGEPVSFFDGETPLMGQGSLKLTVPYTVDEMTAMDAVRVEGPTLTIPGSQTAQDGLFVRVKLENVPADLDGTIPALHFEIKQGGKEFFGANGAVLYSKADGGRTLNNHNQEVYLAHDFDGFIFIPLANMYSTANWGTGNNVDTKQDFTLSLWMCSSQGYAASSGAVLWGGATVTLDHVAMYQGSELGKLVRAADPGFTAVQPETYPLPITFDEGYKPFALTLIDKTEAAPGYVNRTGEVDYPTDIPLNGTASARFAISAGTIRSETNAVHMEGVSGFSKSDFSTLTGMFLRVRIEEDAASTAEHPLQIFTRQDGVSHATILAAGAVAMDVRGRVLDVQVSTNSGVKLPANFDGFLFLPFDKARSEKATDPGQYDQYATHPESMVDFAQDYTLQLKFNDAAWIGTSVTLDDLCIYQGDSYYEFLNGLGYAVKPPRPAGVYGFPMTFEDGETPFTLTQFNTIEENPGYESIPGTVDYTTAGALNGAASAAFRIQKGDIRSETNAVKMEGITGFSKSDFTVNTGIFMRVKITGDDGQAAHDMALLFRQSGLNPATLMCSGAVAYQLNGEQINVSSGVESVKLPAGFDGFLFLPYASARSESVSEPGKYDQFDTYPDSMVDFAKDYTMQLQFKGKSYAGVTVTLDDLSVYAGDDHLAHIRSMGYEVEEAFAITKSTPSGVDFTAPASAKAGETVTLTMGALDESMEAAFDVRTASGVFVSVTKGESAYTFLMPSEPVTVTLTVTQITLDSLGVSLGDVNRDGKVDILDLIRIKRVLAGLDTADYAFRLIGDADSSGGLTAADITALKNSIIG